MKKATKFLAMILCVCLLTGLMAATASADAAEDTEPAEITETPETTESTETPEPAETPEPPASAVVKEVSVTVTEPETGKPPATTAKVPPDADYTVKKVEWTGGLSGGKFKADTSYTVHVTLGIKSGKDAKFSKDDFTAYINGQLMDEFYWNSDSEIEVYGVFDKTEAAQTAEPALVKEVKVTVTEPETGKTPSTTVKVPSGAAYTVKKVEWEGSLSGGKFKADTRYTVHVLLGIKSGTDAKFPEDDFAAYINGQLMDEVKWYSDTEIEVYGVFDKTAAAQTTESTLVKKVEVTVTEPETGKTPATKATVPSGANYTVKKVEWKGGLSGGKFKADTSYTVMVTLGIKSGKNAKFSKDDFAAYINGQLMDEFIWNSNSEIVVYGVFDKTAAAQTATGTKITGIYLTIDAPASGKKPASTGKLSAGSNGTVHSVIKDIKWTGELDTDGTFMPRIKYKVTVTMGIKSGANYYFPDTKNSITATVNGKSADQVLWYDKDKVEVIYTFDAFGTGSTLISSHITMEAPAAGEKPAATAHLAATASTYVSNIRWEGSLDSNGCFQAGTEYTAYLTLKMKDEFVKERKFTTKTFSAYINGVKAGKVTRVSDSELLIAVEFEKTPGTPSAAVTGTFSDVPSSAYFAQPVQWAVGRSITDGIGNNKFGPDQTCNQAQILTFLWRAAGAPKPQGTVKMEGFTGKEYYYQAAMWAAENDMVGGEFNPDAPCTRAMAVGFMWKHAGKPSAAAASFTDVSAGADYANAVSWAVAKQVTDGTGNNKFSPDLTCTRGQIVTFLYRAFAN